MACDEFIGYLLTSFGIPIVLVLFTILPHPLRIITLIISSSFWLVSFLFSSIIWFAVVPLRDKVAFGMVFSVILQEAMRVLFIYCLYKLDRGIKLILSDLRSCDSSTDRSLISVNNVANRASGHNNSSSDHRIVGDQAHDADKLINTTAMQSNEIFNVTTFAYVGGLGFGIISGLFGSLNMLVALYGPGTVGYHGQPADFVDFYAAQTLLVVLGHVASHVIAMRAFLSSAWAKIVAVAVLHLLQSSLTLANSSAQPVIARVVLGLNALLCCALCCWAFSEAGGRVRRLYWAVGLNCRRLNRFLTRRRTTATPDSINRDAVGGHNL